MNETEGSLESALIYALLFSAFGMFMLAIMASRYEQRQTDIENEFRGIQHMQRRAGGTENGTGTVAADGAGESAGEPRESELAIEIPVETPIEKDHSIDISQPIPLMVRLRPLSILLGTVMLGTWAVLMWRRARSRAAAMKTGQPQP